MLDTQGQNLPDAVANQLQAVLASALALRQALVQEQGRLTATSAYVETLQGHYRALERSYQADTYDAIVDTLSARWRFGGLRFDNAGKKVALHMLRWSCDKERAGREVDAAVARSVHDALRLELEAAKDELARSEDDRAMLGRQVADLEDESDYKDHLVGFFKKVEVKI